MKGLVDLDIPGFGCRSKGLVEILSSDLAVGDGPSSRLALHVARFRIGLIADGARFPVLEEVQTLSGDWGFSDDGCDAVGGPLDRNRAHACISVFNLGIASLPELFLQVKKQLEAGLDKTDAFAFDMCFREPCNELKIFASCCQSLARKPYHQRVIGSFRLALPVPGWN